MPTRRLGRLSGALLCTMLPGCATAPSMALFGAGFPAWLFCILIGIFLTVAIHVAAGITGVRQWLSPVALSYPLIATLFAMLSWLIFFPA